MRLAAVIAAALAWVCAAPAAADAAGASVTYECGERECGVGTVSFQLDAGERAALVISGGPDGVTLRDPGKAIRPGHGCVAIAPDAVDCARRPQDCAQIACPLPVHLVSVRLGTDDDTVDATALTGLGVRVLGLGGNDRLAGSPWSDVFVDGDRAGGAIGPDAFEGGGGIDQVIYDDRRGDLRVDLSRDGDQGERGEGDVLRDVESVAGGQGDDFLRAPAGGGQLYGGRGGDTLRGGAGDDELYAGGGHDRLSGGGGDDQLSLGGGRGTVRASCGAGRDSVESVGPRDTLEAGCENVTVESSAAASPLFELSLAHALRVVRADCPDRRCGFMTLRRRGRVIARLRLRQSARGRPAQVVRVPSAQRRRVLDVRFSRGGGFRWSPSPG